MTILTNPTPLIINPLFGSGNYQFSLVKFPEISFMLQAVELPGISLGIANASSSVHDYPIPGETLTYDDLSCTFIVDEKLTNYHAIYSWMMGMGYPVGHKLYKDLMANAKNKTSLSELAKGYTDGVLNILGNDNLPIISVKIRDCFPSRLSGIQFNSNNSDSEPITATVTFVYSYYELVLLNP